MVFQEEHSQVLDSENTMPSPGCILGRLGTPNGATPQVLAPEPFHPECFLVRLNLPE